MIAVKLTVLYAFFSNLKILNKYILLLKALLDANIIRNKIADISKNSNTNILY